MDFLWQACSSKEDSLPIVRNIASSCICIAIIASDNQTITTKLNRKKRSLRGMRYSKSHKPSPELPKPAVRGWFIVSTRYRLVTKLGNVISDTKQVSLYFRNA